MLQELKCWFIRIKWFPIDLKNKSIFKVRNIQYGKQLQTYGTIFVRGTGTISIGNSVSITSCRETNPIGGDTKTILFAKESGRIKIGNNVGLSNVAIVALSEIVIEDNVLIGGNCKIYDHDFHSLKYEERIVSPDLGVKSAAVKIKKGAFIGAHTIILKGVTIGEKCIVGAGSVVTKSIPDSEVWAGNPAKYIRTV